MKTVYNKITSPKFWWLAMLPVLIGVNFLAAHFHYRIDLTKEKRYTLSKATKEMLLGLDDNLQIDIFLKGDFPAGFRKLGNSAEEFLQLLKDRNSSKIHYNFISPQDEIPGFPGKTFEDSLKKLGASHINLSVQVKAGEENKRIYPFALLTYKGTHALVNLYSGGKRVITPVEMNSAEALMEYQFAKTLDGLIHTEKPLIGYSIGNGEPLIGSQVVNGSLQFLDPRTADLQYSLEKNYRIFTLDLNRQSFIPDTFKVLIIVKPLLQFTEDEKLKIDQYIMRGGKLICFMDNLIAEQDSLRFKPETIAFDRNLNLTDLFFRYGVRINTDLVMDLQCDFLPFIVGGTPDNPQYEFLHWNYYPLFESENNHIINKNLGLVTGRFVNSMDSIASAGIRKTVLLSSSSNSRIISTPALISLNENRNAPEDEKFKSKNIPVAFLLEGKFTSLYRNRISKARADSLNKWEVPFLASSFKESKVIVVADGDLVLNDFSPQDGPLSMGLNFFNAGTQYEYQFANRDFLMNCMEYLINKPGIIETRNKNIILRLLNTKKVKEEKKTWQFVNLAIPVLLIIFLGYVYQQLRKRKYTA